MALRLDPGTNRTVRSTLSLFAAAALSYHDRTRAALLRLPRFAGDGVALLTLMTVTLLLTWDRLRHPAHLAQLDLLSQFLPYFSFLGERLRENDIPGWNPHQFSGAPFAGNPQTGFMYLPAMLWFWLLSPLAALKAFVATHIVISAIATYALGRVLGFRPIAALAAGMVYASGPVMSHTACCTVFAAFETWIPVSLLGVELAVRSGRQIRAAGWLLAGLGLSQMLTGWLGQGAYYGLLVLGSFLLLRTVISPPRSSSLPVRLRTLALHGSIIHSMGFGLAAASLLPRLEALNRSTLAGGDYAGTGRAATEGSGWEPLDLPVRFLTVSGGGRYYVGGAVLVLAVVALVVARHRPITAFFMAITAIALVLTLEETPIHSVFYLLPRFETLQSHVPNRILLVAFFGMAMLVGSAIDGFGRSRGAMALMALPTLGMAWTLRSLLPEVRESGLTYFQIGIDATLIVVTILLTASISALPGIWGRTGVQTLVGWVFPIMLLSVLLWVPAGHWWGGGPGGARPRLAGLAEQHAAPAEAAGGAAAFLTNQQTTGHFRYFGFGPTLQRIDKDRCCDYHKHVLEPEGVALLVGNRALTLDLHDVQGYDPVQDARYYAYIHVLNGHPQEYHEATISPTGLDSPLLDLLNARYAVIPAAPAAADSPELARLVAEWPTVYRDERVRILENPEAFPRAWIVHQARRVTREQALMLLADGRVDPRTEALVEITPPSLQTAISPAQDRATITSFAADQIQLEMRTDASGMLVLSEVYDPGWKAYVDGEEVELYQTNYLFRGVQVPAGVHKVELSYAPPALRAGLIVTSFAGVGALGLMLVAAGTWPHVRSGWQTMHAHGQRGKDLAKRRLYRRQLDRPKLPRVPSRLLTFTLRKVKSNSRFSFTQTAGPRPLRKRPPTSRRRPTVRTNVDHAQPTNGHDEVVG